MNNSINYSTFIELLIESNDDDEPYGLATPVETITVTGGENEFTLGQGESYD